MGKIADGKEIHPISTLFSHYHEKPVSFTSRGNKTRVSDFQWGVGRMTAKKDVCVSEIQLYNDDVPYLMKIKLFICKASNIGYKEYS